MNRLAGKVALITGAGAGIGRATALRFAEEGAKVVIADLDRATGQQTEQIIKSANFGSGGEAFYVETDVSDHKSLISAIGKSLDRFGELHIVHNNAGGSTMNDGPVTEAPEAEFWRVMKLDVFGTFLTSKYCIPEMIKAGGGSIINMSSNLALMGIPGRDCYTAGKGAIAAMTRSMAVEYAKNNIRVNAIAPSVTKTDRVEKFLASDPKIVEQLESHLLGLIQPIDVANMAVYLASEESSVVTGQVFPIDSGITVS